jgi:hypothetical protein
MVWKKESTKPNDTYPNGRRYQGYFCPNSVATDKTKHKPFEFEWIEELPVKTIEQ